MSQVFHSVYIHIPFCKHRCAYCDFNTYAGLEGLISAYVNALNQEINSIGLSSECSIPVHTVFLGGGTPSLLSIEQLSSIMEAIRYNFKLTKEPEISLEANPGTVSLDYLRGIVQLGFNRLSMGMQSANSQDLRVLERQHTLDDTANAVEWARLAGFRNINLDLIFGIPGQTLESWQNTISMALSLRVDHLALYALSIEHGTPLAYWTRKGLVMPPDPDLAADMYEYAVERLHWANYEQYEISNWAKLDENRKSAVCLHNLQYWLTQPYFGFGAGAHGFILKNRTVNVMAPAAYIDRLSSTNMNFTYPRTAATIELNHVDGADLMGEYMMMGLRLVKAGVSKSDFYQMFGQPLDEIYGEVIQRHLRNGLLEWSNESLRLTKAGYLLGNQVFKDFLPG